MWRSNPKRFYNLYLFSNIIFSICVLFLETTHNFSHLKKGQIYRGIPSLIIWKLVFNWSKFLRHVMPYFQQHKKFWHALIKDPGTYLCKTLKSVLKADFYSYRTMIYHAWLFQSPVILSIVMKAWRLSISYCIDSFEFWIMKS